MLRLVLATVLSHAALSAASATIITIEVPGDEKPETTRVDYACGGRKVTATYINTSDSQFAVLDLGDKTIVTVSVISGSGARYVGQQYEWWSKGDEAQFTDLMQDPPKTVACSSAK
jgi:membrane-bound inhibitor of C-type lysozyme